MNAKKTAQFPARVREQLRQTWRRRTHPAWYAFFRHRTTPVSERWGHDRGTPIDRHYIESFLREHRDDIRDCVMEIRESRYTDLFGTNLSRRDVLDIDSGNARARYRCDLASADCVPGDSVNCFILTQTLQFIYEPRAAIAHVNRILKPGGVVLATVPGISRIDGALADVDYWRFSAASCAKLFGACFGADNVRVRAYGNALTAMGFLTGMACQEFSAAELQVHDPEFPVIVAVRAVKRGAEYK